MSKPPMGLYAITVSDNAENVYEYLRDNKLPFDMDFGDIKQITFTILRTTKKQRKRIKSIAEHKITTEELIKENVIIIMNSLEAGKLTFKNNDEFFYTIDELFESIRNKDLYTLIWVSSKDVKREDIQKLKLEITKKFTIALLD